MMVKQSMIHYHIGWKPCGNQPGAKRGLNAGIGDQLRALVLLRDHPDPRRLDLRASMRDPFERLWVRDFYLNTAFKVIVLVDISASMGYVGMVNRMQVAEEITAQLAISAYRAGDAFGVFAANEKIQTSGVLPAKINRSAWVWVCKEFSKIKPQGKGVDGFFKVIPQLPLRRSLVFIISDFQWPNDQCHLLLKALNHHDVVPIVLKDPAETAEMPSRGIATIQDMETGQRKFVWLRAGLQEKIKAMVTQRALALNKVFSRYGTQPFIVDGHFNAAYLNRYFMERNR
jgi:uncharacterized protein (DUF58 family)